MYAPAYLGLASCETQVPSFSWSTTDKSEYGVPLLVVHFPDGGPDDVALLSRFNPIARCRSYQKLQISVYKYM
jgi:hypothetical protein